jgi:hypothetical protein
MSYFDIFSLGWNLNALTFVINFLVAISILKSTNQIDMHKESQVLNDLKDEYEKVYPNRKYETIMSYIIPFTAMFRTIYKMIEMKIFFNKNKNAKIFDFIVYKYKTDINRIKN